MLSSKSLIILAHGQFFSIFNILSNQWVYHQQYESEIVQMLRLKRADADFIFYILFKNGLTKKMKILSSGEEDEQLDFKVSEDLMLQGQIKYFSNDREKSSCMLVHCVDSDNKPLLYVFYKDTYNDITQQVPTLQADSTSFFLYNSD